MSDALKRARGGSTRGSGAETEGGDHIAFFDPDEPAVALPWDIGTDLASRSVVGDPLVRSDESSAMVFVQQEPGVEDGIEYSSAAGTEQLVVSPAIAPMARDQYTKLAAALHQAQLDRGIQIVLLTSARRGEGATLTAVNLALTFSESLRRRVLLVDADVRRPTVHEVLRISNARGLSESLAIDGPFPLAEMSPRLSVLTGGQDAVNPMKTLTSNRMRFLIDEARRKFDWVLLDVAPAAVLPDASLLGSLVDVTLLVALAGRTSYDVIQRAVEAIGHDNIFGVVLNRVSDAALPRSDNRDRRNPRRR